MVARVFVLVLLTTSSVYADFYKQVLIYGVNASLCQSINDAYVQQASSIIDGVSLFECSPSDGYARVSIGGTNPQQAIDILKSITQAQMGKDPDLQINIAPGTRVTDKVDLK